MLVPEIVGCGIFDSMIAYRGLSQSPQRKVSCFEIEFYPEDGRASVIDGKEFPIVAGNLVIAKPGQVRSSLLHMRNHYLWLAPCDCEVCDMLKNAPNVVSNNDPEVYLGLLSDIRKSRESTFDGSQFYTSAKVMELMSRICTDAERNKRRSESLVTDTKSSVGVLHAAKFIDENFSDKITLEDAAKQASLSPIYFHRLFTVIMGKTPHEYLLEKRLLSAKDMLISGEVPLCEIAFSCGFGSQSYFNSVFKKETGTTPCGYRRAKLSRK